MAFITPTLLLPAAASNRGPPRRRCFVQASAQAPAPVPSAKPTRVAALRSLLADEKGLLLMPCCYDALSARLVERAGFALTFMSGFSTAAARGLPDTGLMSYGEMRDSVAAITETLGIPVIADADTGYGAAANVRRTVLGYAAAGAAGLLIEDQVWPKRCGHTRGKAVVGRAEAVGRVRAAVDARAAADGGDGGPVIVARTDAGRGDFEEALERARLFHAAGADVTFVEAPRSVEELARVAREVPGRKLVNCLEQGETPILAPRQLREMGFAIAAYPLTLLSAAVKAQEEALRRLRAGDPAAVQPLLKDFADLRDVVGFTEYYDLEARYKAD